MLKFYQGYNEKLQPIASLWQKSVSVLIGDRGITGKIENYASKLTEGKILPSWTT